MRKSDLQTQVATQVGEKSSPSVPRRTKRRERVLAIRVSDEEYARIVRFFEEEGVPAATGARSVLLKYVNRSQQR